MHYLDETEKIIRNSWFKNHAVKYIEGEDGLKRIVWGANGTSMYEIIYTLSGRSVFISGDLGDAVYELTCDAIVKNIRDHSLEHFTGKLTASERDKWEFNQDKARVEIQELFMEWCDVDDIMDLEEDARTLYNDLLNAAKSNDTHAQFEQEVCEIYTNTDVDWFDLEAVDYIVDCGKRLSRSFVAYWLGLIMIAEQSYL